MYTAVWLCKSYAILIAGNGTRRKQWFVLINEVLNQSQIPGIFQLAGHGCTVIVSNIIYISLVLESCLSQLHSYCHLVNRLTTTFILFKLIFGRKILHKKILAYLLQFAKFAKIFSLQNFVSYGSYSSQSPYCTLLANYMLCYSLAKLGLPDFHAMHT